MGNNDSKPSGPQGMLQQQMSCTDNLMCQNIDSRRSVPGQDPVLVCPDATCVAGKCQCGDNCDKDPYTGMCCTKLIERVVKTPMGEEKTTFCVEGEGDPLLDGPASTNEPGMVESFASYSSAGYKTSLLS